MTVSQGVDVGADAAFLDAVTRIADDVAAVHAEAVDREGRFPIEAIDALRDAGALSAAVPTDLGGAGVSLAAVAAGCLALGRRCGATGLIFAMHQIQISTIVRHRPAGSWFDEYLRDVVASRRLVASVTSEVGTGGNMGRSIAAATAGDGDIVTFEKQAPTVSYGAYADDLLVSLRRDPEAEESDQVLLLAARDQLELTPKGTWDPLGMRGTCSPGYVARGTVPSAQVLTAPFGEISSATMVPVSHVLWSHVWLGIASDAFDRARAFVRASARRSPGSPQPLAQRLSHVLADLTLLRATVDGGLRDYLEIADEEGHAQLGRMSTQLRFNTLKTAASDQAPLICQGAMSVCGIVGFKNDSPFSIGRHLRDAMSGCLMVSNDRIHETNASLLLIAKDV